MFYRWCTFWEWTVVKYARWYRTQCPHPFALLAISDFGKVHTHTLQKSWCIKASIIWLFYIHDRGNFGSLHNWRVKKVILLVSFIILASLGWENCDSFSWMSDNWLLEMEKGKLSFPFQTVEEPHVRIGFFWFQSELSSF